MNVGFPQICDSNAQSNFGLKDINLAVDGGTTPVLASAGTISISDTTTGGTHTLNLNGKNFSALNEYYNPHYDSPTYRMKVVQEFTCPECGYAVMSYNTACPVCGEPRPSGGWGGDSSYQFVFTSGTYSGKTNNQGGKFVLGRTPDVCMTQRDYRGIADAMSVTKPTLTNDKKVLTKNSTTYETPFNGKPITINSGGSTTNKHAYVFEESFIPESVPFVEPRYIRIVSGKTQTISGDGGEISGVVITNTTHVSASVTDTDMFPNGVTYSEDIHGNFSKITFHADVGMTGSGRLGTITFTGDSATTKYVTVTQGAVEEFVNFTNYPSTLVSSATGITYTVECHPSATVYLKKSGSPDISQNVSGTTTGTFAISENTGLTPITYTLSAVTLYGNASASATVVHNGVSESVSITAATPVDANATSISYSVSANPSATVEIRSGATPFATQQITGNSGGTFAISANSGESAITYTLCAYTPHNISASATVVQNAESYVEKEVFIKVSSPIVTGITDNTNFGLSDTIEFNLIFMLNGYSGGHQTDMVQVSVPCSLQKINDKIVFAFNNSGGGGDVVVSTNIKLKGNVIYLRNVSLLQTTLMRRYTITDNTQQLSDVLNYSPTETQFGIDEYVVKLELVVDDA